MKSILALLLMYFAPGMWSSGIKNACKVSIDEKPVVRIDDHLQGIWKLKEDTDSHNYFIIEKDGDYEYSITYMNCGGNNRGLEHGGFFFSEINGVKYINIGNWDEDYRGYIFFKIKSISKGSWDMVANLVTDPALTKVKDRSELRKLLAQDADNPTFLGKELHFRKKFEFNSFHAK